jgi:hypothetical protein
VRESLTLSIQAEAIASLAKTLTILFRGVKQAKEEENQKKEGKRQTSAVFEENTADVFSLKALPAGLLLKKQHVLWGHLLNGVDSPGCFVPFFCQDKAVSLRFLVKLVQLDIHTRKELVVVTRGPVLEIWKL